MHDRAGMHCPNACVAPLSWVRVSIQVFTATMCTVAIVSISCSSPGPFDVRVAHCRYDTICMCMGANYSASTSTMLGGGVEGASVVSY